MAEASSIRVAVLADGGGVAVVVGHTGPEAILGQVKAILADEPAAERPVDLAPILPGGGAAAATFAEGRT